MFTPMVLSPKLFNFEVTRQYLQSINRGFRNCKIKSDIKATNNFLTAKLEPVAISKKNSVELKASLRVLKMNFKTISKYWQQ